MQKVVIDDNGCWLWQGCMDGRGYGKISLYRLGKRTVKERVHRIMYMAVHGPIPNGLVVRHRCDNKRCCNPYHLEVGTKSENAYDYYLRGRAQKHYEEQEVEIKEPPF